jgi:hypothetical protein
MFTPLGPWSSKGGAAWRCFLEDHAPPDFFLVAMEGNWFSGASVQTGALAGAKGVQARESIRISKTCSDYSILKEIRLRDVSSSSYFASVSGDSNTRIPVSKQATISLSDRFEVLAGCSTGAAYELVPYIYDDEQATGRKLINTKLIDRFRPRWGKVGMKYLKSDYQAPRWPTIDEPGLPKSVQGALLRQMRPKVLVAGLTKVLEAFGDYDDEFAGVVQTWAIVCRSNEERMIRRLTACINSWFASYQYWRMEGSQSIVGGGMTIKKAALNMLAIPESICVAASCATNTEKSLEWLSSGIDLDIPFDPSEGWGHIEYLCRDIEDRASAGKPFLDFEERLNRLICSAYGLAEADFSYLKEWHLSRDLKDAER